MFYVKPQNITNNCFKWVFLVMQNELYHIHRWVLHSYSHMHRTRSHLVLSL